MRLSEQILLELDPKIPKTLIPTDQIIRLAADIAILEEKLINMEMRLIKSSQKRRNLEEKLAEYENDEAPRRRADAYKIRQLEEALRGARAMITNYSEQTIELRKMIEMALNGLDFKGGSL